MTIADFVKAQGIKASIKQIGERPDRNMEGMDPAARHYRVQIRKGRRSMVVYFSQGSGIRHAPTIEDVLDCLASDASGYENARSFEEWCGEYGYDTDSRRAERTYKAVERQANALKRVIGDSEAFSTLLFEVERL